MVKYSVGIDYGTLSARGLLIELEQGNEIDTIEYIYPHGIMTYKDFGDNNERDSALQNPNDYIQALEYIIKHLILNNRISPDLIVGVGIDFTASTILPIKLDGTPLCNLREFKANPHSYVKLWKHHGGNSEAEIIGFHAEESKQKWLEAFGGKVSSEWMFPKVFETLNSAPEIYESADRFIEAGDWIAMKLTGHEVHSSCMAGFKGQWSKKSGFPDNKFWCNVDSRLENIIGTKISEKIDTVGTKVGNISEEASLLTGLPSSVAVAAPIIDAHAALPAAGIITPGKLMIIVGTSACHILLSEKDIDIMGIFGKVEDGVIPGYFAYEAGQTCVGDLFEWFTENCVPKKYFDNASANNMSVIDYITNLSENVDICKNRIIALDWWNGNRSPYADFSLSGVITGLRLSTKSEHIFRALLESCAYGTRRIVELYENSGIKIDEIIACGGISKKNRVFMQIMSDVIGKPIRIVGTNNASARGSAIFGAVSGGYFNSLEEAAKKLSDKCDTVYSPNAACHEVYSELYLKYLELSEYYAKTNRKIMSN